MMVVADFGGQEFDNYLRKVMFLILWHS